MNLKPYFHLLGYLIAIAISIILLFLVIASVWIGHEMKNLCQTAKWQYGQDECVEALISQLDDETQGFRARNHAIWALGQLGDDRGKLVLEKYYTGIIPDREPLDDTISQYELKKAISLLNDDTNIWAWTWRDRLKD